MKKITLTFGLLSGAIIIVYSFIIFLVFGDFSKMSPSQFQIVEALGWLRYIIIALTVYYSMQVYKRQEVPPHRYGALAKQGILVALVIAVCVGLMEWVYLLLNPRFYEQYTQLYEVQLKASGASAENIKAAQEQMEQYKWMQTPAMTGIFYFFETTLIGSVAALLIARFMKTKPPKPSIV